MFRIFGVPVFVSYYCYDVGETFIQQTIIKIDDVNR